MGLSKAFSVLELDAVQQEFNHWVKKIPGEEMATHSSTLTWEIPWTEEPGGLQSWGCKRV